MKLEARSETTLAIVDLAVKSSAVRLVACWLALRTKDYRGFGQYAANQLKRDIEADIGEFHANAPCPSGRSADGLPGSYSRCIEFADLYGAREWPVRSWAHALMRRSEQSSLEDALEVATEAWDQALECYEDFHARWRRRSGVIHRHTPAAH